MERDKDGSDGRKPDRGAVLDHLERADGLRPGAARAVAAETGVPEAEVYGTGSFYGLLARPDAKVRVCIGLSCRLSGADALFEAAKRDGLPVETCSCLAACDAPPAALRERTLLPGLTELDVDRCGGDWTRLTTRGSAPPSDAPHLSGPVFDLAGDPDPTAPAFQRAIELGPEGVLAQLEASGLQGRGGAGFPAHRKWSGVRLQPDPLRYVVLNADEGEPGTFKDRDLLLRRHDLVLEGCAIAAFVVGAQDVYLYLRGEFEGPGGVLERVLGEAEATDRFPGIRFHLHTGHGSYVCGEETALLEALEGKRGMPRHRPPYPVEKGLWGGRTEPGTKLYSVSGHVRQPGNYELPMGVCLDELVEAAGGYDGELKAFSPGGASSGFLPASERTRPLDFGSLAELQSMLGSAGVVVMNQSVDMRFAALTQLRFFEAESCGQCAPCRIGSQYLREALERHCSGEGGVDPLAHVAEVAWQMNEGSICGLGQTAPLPLTSALNYFPRDFKR
jgi:NADH:ubiquinone oxidoreductase subunit F (NADH-binding)